MNKKKYILIPVLIMAIIIISIVVYNKKESAKNNFVEPKEIKEISKQENITEEEKIEISDVKSSTGLTGENQLYDVQENYGIKVAVIKPSVKYKVAFVGMIKNSKPEIEKLDNIVTQNHPKYAGIWVYEQDRERFLKLLKKITISDYKIDENGYLRISNKSKQNDNDKKIEQIINGDKLYIIRISSVCYIVDDVTGEILEYNFENMDKYQTYEYFEEEDKKIIFVTQNSNKRLSDDEIIKSIIDLF